MTHSAANLPSCSDRRKSLRHYLTRPMRAELIYGRQRIAIESGSISNISKDGIGLRTTVQGMKVIAGATVTIAVPQTDKVLTLSGKVTTIRSGIDIGILIDAEAQSALGDMFDSERDSAVVSAPQAGKSRLGGTVSISARHPMRWALQAGATRFDLSGVVALDSSGIGMLLRLNEREGVTIEKCSSHVCRLVKLCGTANLCSPDCESA